MPTLPTVAIIGAGSSGIAAAKALHERGVVVANGHHWDRRMRRRYVASERHTIQVDFDTYLYDLRRERRRGAARAAAAGRTLPVPARARVVEAAPA